MPKAATGNAMARTTLVHQKHTAAGTALAAGIIVRRTCVDYRRVHHVDTGRKVVGRHGTACFLLTLAADRNMGLASLHRFARAEAYGLFVPVNLADGVLELPSLMADLAYSPAYWSVSRLDDPMVPASWLGLLFEYSLDHHVFHKVFLDYHDLSPGPGAFPRPVRRAGYDPNIAKGALLKKRGQAVSLFTAS